jgi:hypothetical protein
MKKRIAQDDGDKAPLLGSWAAWYILVVVVLLLSIGAFYWLTKHFS